MKEVVVISGKGGTGKTSITASFASFEKENMVVADCDVDAADLHLLLQPNSLEATDFYSGHLANIDQAKCTQCGICENICRFDAIKNKGNGFFIEELNCEGCGYCEKVCPTKAIQMISNKVGQLFISTTKYQQSMVHAKLGIGAENSGKLVAEVKKRAREIATEQGKKLILVDGSPGIGCPVISSLSGAHFVVFVTEPSKSGFHDLQRVYELVRKFKIKAGCIINKFDINPEYTQKIRSYLITENIELLGVIPYDERFTKAMLKGQSIVEYKARNIKEIVQYSFEKVKQLIEQ